VSAQSPQSPVSAPTHAYSIFCSEHSDVSEREEQKAAPTTVCAAAPSAWLALRASMTMTMPVSQWATGMRRFARRFLHAAARAETHHLTAPRLN